jgi:hypothetical protein
MKKIKTRYKLLAGILLAVLAAVTGLYVIPKWYVRQGEKMAAYDINPENSGTRILIAVQKSSFKDAVLDSVAAACRGRDIHIRVVDVDALPDTDINDWDKIIIFSAIMMWEFYPAVEDFLETSENKDKIFMYNTSGSTRMQHENIDTITSPSTGQVACVSALLAIIDGAVRVF